MPSIRNTKSRISRAQKVTRRLGIFRARDLVDAGFPREYLRRLLDQKAVQKIGRGLYLSADFDFDQNLSLVGAALRVPRGVVCLASALQFHGIGTQAPHELWLALPRGTRPPRLGKTPVKFCTFSPECHVFGVQKHALTGGTVRIYSPAKTVADCFKYRRKYGLDMAIEALREGWRGKRFTMKDLTTAADVCRVRRIMQPYLEMLT